MSVKVVDGKKPDTKELVMESDYIPCQKTVAIIKHPMSSTYMMVRESANLNHTISFEVMSLVLSSYQKKQKEIGGTTPVNVISGNDLFSINRILFTHNNSFTAQTYESMIKEYSHVLAGNSNADNIFIFFSKMLPQHKNFVDNCVDRHVYSNDNFLGVLTSTIFKHFEPEIDNHNTLNGTQRGVRNFVSTLRGVGVEPYRVMLSIIRKSLIINGHIGHNDNIFDVVSTKCFNDSKVDEDIENMKNLLHMGHKVSNLILDNFDTAGDVDKVSKFIPKDNFRKNDTTPLLESVNDGSDFSVLFHKNYMDNNGCQEILSDAMARYVPPVADSYWRVDIARNATKLLFMASFAITAPHQLREMFYQNKEQFYRVAEKFSEDLEADTLWCFSMSDDNIRFLLSLLYHQFDGDMGKVADVINNAGKVFATITHPMMITDYADLIVDVDPETIRLIIGLPNRPGFKYVRGLESPVHVGDVVASSRIFIDSDSNLRFGVLTQNPKKSVDSHIFSMTTSEYLNSSVEDFYFDRSISARKKYSPYNVFYNEDIGCLTIQKKY